MESRLDPIERLAELEKDRSQAKGDIREILDRLAEKHGATVRDVTAAMPFDRGYVERLAL
jgi:hypothetical protein